MVFLQRPISLAFVIASVLLLIVMSMPALKKRRSDITG